MCVCVCDYLSTDRQVWKFNNGETFSKFTWKKLHNGTKKISPKPCV